MYKTGNQHESYVIGTSLLVRILFDVTGASGGAGGACGPPVIGLIKVDLEFSFSIPGLFQTWNSNKPGFEKLNSRSEPGFEKLNSRSELELSKKAIIN